MSSKELGEPRHRTWQRIVTVCFPITLPEMDRTFGRLDVANLHEVRHYTLSELDRFLNVAGTPPGKYLRYAAD
jgi:hypothetical protein